MTDKPVVFFHVMKCGGTSVRYALTLAAAGGGESPGIFELDGEAAKIAAGGSNVDNWRFRDALLPYALEAMQPSIVLGHFRYRDRYERYLERAHFVTVLRDPVQRLVSLYRYRRYKGGIDVPVSGNFTDFIRSTRWAKEGHHYVDTFRGSEDKPDARSAEAVAAAVNNLRRFAAVGDVNHLDDFAHDMAELLNKPVSISLLNPSPAPETGSDEVTAASLEEAREVCDPDIQVYEAVLAGSRRTATTG